LHFQEVLKTVRQSGLCRSGKHLLFHRRVEHGVSIKIINRFTGDVTTLVGADEKPRQASLDPQSKRVVYCAEIGGRLSLRVINIRGGPSTPLDTGGYEACYPRWSPDGKKIAFVSKGAARWEVCSVEETTKNLKCWTTGYEDLHGMFGPIDWSPDSNRIAFKADLREFESDLFYIDTRSGTTTRVTADEWFDESPSWTPDGRKILFMSTRGGNWTWGLFAFSLDSGQIETLEAPSFVEKNFPRAHRISTMWSTRDDRGKEFVAEREVSGNVRIWGQHPGARWPSSSADGKFLLFTLMAEHVEYWMAENLLGKESPLLAGDAEQQGSLPVSEPQTVPNAQELQRSPIVLHHR
jgi:TolB protein